MLFLCTSTLARADRVDREVYRLRSHKPYKVRLSAALYLAKSSDLRAIRALVHAVQTDGGRTIRRVAATALGNTLSRDGATGQMRESTMLVLRGVYRSERDRKVRRSVSRALRKLDSAVARQPGFPKESSDKPQRPFVANRVRDRALVTQHAARSAGTSVFIVHVQAPRDSTGRAPRGALHGMRRVVQRSLSDHVQVSIGKLPQRGPGNHGVFVGMSVDSLRVKSYDSYQEVHCAVSIQVNPWQGEGRTERWQMDRAAQASGKGRAVAAPGRVGIGAAKLDCLMTVTKSVAAKRLVPFIRRVSTDKRFAQRR